MMDGGIRSAGLGRKQATARSNELAGAESRASGQMAGTGGKAAAPPGRWASTPPPSPNSSYQHLHSFLVPASALHSDME